jgi:hypothetical protein
MSPKRGSLRHCSRASEPIALFICFPSGSSTLPNFESKQIRPPHFCSISINRFELLHCNLAYHHLPSIAIMFRKPTQPPQSPRICHRLAALHTHLAEISTTLAVRTYFVQHNIHEHYHCPTCILSSPGSYGPTCPLLRPYLKSSKIPYPKINAAWMQRRQQDSQVYSAIVDEVQRYSATFRPRRKRRSNAVEEVGEGGRALEEECAELGREA